MSRSSANVPGLLNGADRDTPLFANPNGSATYTLPAGNYVGELLFVTNDHTANCVLQATNFAPAATSNIATKTAAMLVWSGAKWFRVSS